jgi:hypothetical protein
MTGIDARNPSDVQDGQNVNPHDKAEWLIRKNGYYYRPGSCGYTSNKDEAGRYTKKQAEAEARVEPENIHAIHESEIPDSAAVTALKAERDALLDKIATAYQIVGALSLATGLIDHPDVQRALDYLSDDDDHAELEPWPKTPFERDAPQAALDAERAARRELVSKRSRKRDLVPGLLRAREIIAAEERNDDPDLALGYHFLSRWAVDMFDFEIRKADEAEGGASIDEATAAAIYAADLILSDLKVVEAERDALQAENDRLREALKEIEAFGPGITHGWAVGVRSIAHAALNKEGA